MKARFYYDRDIQLDLIRSETVAIIGYGNQGQAHALNLRDSGVDVVIGLHPGSPSRAKAAAEGFQVLPTPEAVERATCAIMCTPDEIMAEIYEGQVGPFLAPGNTLLFAHGFNIHFGLIAPPDQVDVALVSPKGSGASLRKRYEERSGLAALVAAGDDSSDRAFHLALSYAGALGCGRVGILQTTFKEETETDLFGEQAVLCGGMPELLKQGFHTLVEAGYQPEVAYFECVIEAKLILDLIVERGFAGMREAISNTAEWGGYLAAERVVGHASRNAMRDILHEVQNGHFAKAWLQESRTRGQRMARFRDEEKRLALESTGVELSHALEKGRDSGS